MALCERLFSSSGGYGYHSHICSLVPTLSQVASWGRFLLVRHSLADHCRSRGGLQESTS